ncbi:MAG: hypothetical protein J6Y91_04090 [Alphaproteobacteria bacterium]|nr:hypothetical protein [Alphaproteobacteria bacterium]
MENTFWNTVGASVRINQIEAQNLRCAVEKAYRDSVCGFHQNAELIDVKDRFRIFRFQNCDYLAKKMSLPKAELEITNSQKAAAILSGKTVNGKDIRVIVPQKIVINPDDEYCFLLSEYLGHTLHESTYTGIYPDFSVDDCLALLRTLLQNGIVYRGYLQRNIIIGEKAVYLFDWEDSYFRNQPADHEFNNLWHTNFVLNWSYIFAYDELVGKLAAFRNNYTPENEPPLVKYENIFKNLVNLDVADDQLRNIIEKIVFKAELPATLPSRYFYIRPHDMGHLIADTFPGEIDLFYDILACAARTENEASWLQMLQTLTHFYVLYYRDKTAPRPQLSAPLQNYILAALLMNLDNFMTTDNFAQIMSATTMKAALEVIKNAPQTDSFAYLYCHHRLQNRAADIENAIRRKMLTVCPTAQNISEVGLHNISRYILQKADHTAIREAA